MTECAVCSASTKKDLFTRYGGSYYCSEACWDSLFLPCNICGHKNLTCSTNLKHPYIFGAPLEQACDQCLQKKHNVGIVTITSERM